MDNNHGHKSHGLWMMLCCLVPIILLGVLFSSNIGGSYVRTVLGGLLILACPLGHILMMMFMGKDHGHGSYGSHSEQYQDEEKEETVKKSCH